MVKRPIVATLTSIENDIFNEILKFITHFCRISDGRNPLYDFIVKQVLLYFCYFNAEKHKLKNVLSLMKMLQQDNVTFKNFYFP